MPKDKLTDYSATNASNTDVGGVNIDEGMLPSAVNNAIRELLTHLKNFASGTDGIDVLSLADDTATNAIKLQAPSSVTTTTTLTLPDGDGTDGQVLSTDGSGALSFVNTTPAPSLIINGDMAVHQRGGTITDANAYTLDRWQYTSVNYDELAVAITQDTDAPTGSGFVNSLKIDVTTAETSGLAADEVVYFTQKIESQNLTHLNFGSASAKSITLSFWVKSSLTGKYSLCLWRPNDNRSNTLSYTIDSANTWEYKTITYDGDTGGSNFLDDNTAGLWLFFMLSAGTDWSGTPHTGWGVYAATDDLAHSDMVDFTAQTGTFYITGVKLEVGTTATPFKHESYEENLAKCQRYFQKFGDVTSNGYTGLCIGSAYATSAIRGVVNFPVTMRSVPSLTTSGNFVTLPSALSVTSIVLADDGGNPNCTVNFTVSGATAGYAYLIRANNDADAHILFNAEL